jgi:hypothetical protein
VVAPELGERPCLHVDVRDAVEPTLQRMPPEHGVRGAVPHHGLVQDADRRTVLAVDPLGASQQEHPEAPL